MRLANHASGLRSRTLHVAVATATILATGLATAAVASAAPSATPSPSSSPSSSSSGATHPHAHARGGRVARFLLRELRGEGGAIGKTSDVSATSLTLTGAKGKTHSYTVNAATVVHVDHGRKRTTGSITDVTDGERVVVRAAKADGSAARAAATIDVLLPRTADPSPSTAAAPSSAS